MKKSISKNNNYKFYHFARGCINILGNIYFGGKIIGKENIPKEGRCILAGNHESNFDSYLLMSATKREIHFLAKKELLDGKFGWLFRLMHLIPVDRQKKNPEARLKAINILNEERVLGIFPEGTFHKEDIILPFKPGVIDFALKTNSLIIPFAIIGPLKFRSHPIIKFGKPIDISQIEEENKLGYFENVIKNMIIDLKANKK